MRLLHPHKPPPFLVFSTFPGGLVLVDVVRFEHAKQIHEILTAAGIDCELKEKERTFGNRDRTTGEELGKITIQSGSLLFAKDDIDRVSEVLTVHVGNLT